MVNLQCRLLAPGAGIAVNSPQVALRGLGQVQDRRSREDLIKSATPCHDAPSGQALPGIEPCPSDCSATCADRLITVFAREDDAERKSTGLPIIYVRNYTW